MLHYCTKYFYKIFILGNIPCQHLLASLCPMACANLSAAAYSQWPVRPVSGLFWGPSLTYCPGQFFSSLSWEIFSEPWPPPLLPAILLHMQIVFGTGFCNTLLYPVHVFSYKISISNYCNFELNTIIKQVECSKSQGLNCSNNMGQPKTTSYILFNAFST